MELSEGRLDGWFSGSVVMVFLVNYRIIALFFVFCCFVKRCDGFDIWRPLDEGVQ